MIRALGWIAGLAVSTLSLGCATPSAPTQTHSERLETERILGRPVATEPLDLPEIQSGDVEEVLPALGKAAGVAHLQTVLLAGDDPEELDALPTVEFHVGDVLVVPEGVLGSADVGVLGGYREGFQHL